MDFLKINFLNFLFFTITTLFKQYFINIYVCVYTYFYVHTHTSHGHHSMTLYVTLSQFFTCCIVFQCQGLFIYLAGIASNVEELWEKEQTGGPQTESAGVLGLPSEAPAEAPGHAVRDARDHTGKAACRECVTDSVQREHVWRECVRVRNRAECEDREYKGICKGLNMRVCWEVLAGKTWWREMTELSLGAWGKQGMGKQKKQTRGKEAEQCVWGQPPHTTDLPDRLDLK